MAVKTFLLLFLALSARAQYFPPASQAQLQSLAATVATKADAASLSSVATSGAYSDLLGKPTIPTSVGQLTNDLGFVTPAGVLTAPLTGFTVGTGTVNSSDTVFTAIRKLAGAGGGGGVWGSITGTLSAQTDLSTALAAKQATLVPGHDLWVDRNGSDTASCSVAAPCQTVGYALTLVSSPSSTNNWTIHLLSGRHDQETGDLLIPPYTWIVGSGGPDVGSYLRLPSGKAIKVSSGWTVNGRGGIQSVYLGGGTSVNLDFAALGGSAGSNFMLDDVFVTGSFTHTGRGVNGGDFLYIQNSFIFGAASLTGSELQSLNSTWGSSVTAATGTAVGSDLTFLGGGVSGAFSFTQGNGQNATLSTSGTTYNSTFTTVGTIALTADLNLPIGYTLSGATTRTNTSNAASVPYSPATPGNWSPAPSAVAAALDQLAARPGIPTLTAGSVPISTGPGFTQDNTNFFFDTTNHSLSVGPGPHPATSADLAISSQASDTKVGLSVFTTSSNNAVQINSQNAFSLAAQVASATNSPSINFERARGTLAAKTQALAGDILGSFVFNGYTGSADGAFAAGFGVVATENQAAGHAGSSMLFETTSNGSTTLIPRLEIDQDGTVEPYADNTTPLGKTSLRFKDAHFSDVLQIGVRGAGSTPACAAANNGTLSFTSSYLLCVCNGSSWVKTADGSTSCTF